MNPNFYMRNMDVDIACLVNINIVRKSKFVPTLEKEKKNTYKNLRKNCQ